MPLNSPASRSGAPPAPWLRLLPLLLLAAMIAIGFGLEAVFYDQVTWLAKLPLIAMLALAFVRGRR